jgi:nucleotide-binding universal stress UspA family protein
MTIKRIVVGVDGSPQSAGALDWAADLAITTGAEIVAVHAFELGPYLPGAMGPPYTMDRGAVANNLLRELSEWCAPLHQREVAFHTVLREGVAGVELLRVAAEESADLIVVGSRSRGPLRELLLGSVAHHVTHHATHPVAVVPSRADLATERAPTTASRGTA